MSLPCHTMTNFLDSLPTQYEAELNATLSYIHTQGCTGGTRIVNSLIAVCALIRKCGWLQPVLTILKKLCSRKYVRPPFSQYHECLKKKNKKLTLLLTIHPLPKRGNVSHLLN